MVVLGTLQMKPTIFSLQLRYKSDLVGMKGIGWLALRSPQIESAKKAGELISEVPSTCPPTTSDKGKLAFPFEEGICSWSGDPKGPHGHWTPSIFGEPCATKSQDRMRFPTAEELKA